MNRYQYEEIPGAFEGAYTVANYPGIAFRVLGLKIEEWYDEEVGDVDCSITDRLVVQMIGDDRHILADQCDVEPLDESGYCRSCGQIGCAHGR